jgi:hypothetical protein
MFIYVTSICNSYHHLLPRSVHRSVILLYNFNTLFVFAVVLRVRCVLKKDDKGHEVHKGITKATKHIARVVSIKTSTI